MHERLEMPEQHRRGLAADAGYAGDVVDGIAHEREETRHALGDHAEARRDIPIGEAHIADVIPVLVAGPYELRQVLVARHEHDVVSGGTHFRRERADDVVGLVLVARETRDAKSLAQAAAQPELTFEVFGRRLAIRLV